MSGIVPHKACRLGFKIQTALGARESQASVVFPLPEGADFVPKWTKDIYQNNQGNYERTHYFTSAYIAEGGIKIPWVPGMLADGTELYQWLFDRDDANYYEGNYATLFFDYGGNYYVVADVKCTGGTITPEKNRPVYLTINARSGAEPIAGSASNFPSYSTDAWFDGSPYVGEDIYIQLDITGEGLAVDEWTKGHSLEWDNQVMDAGDASLITYQRGPGPYALPNLARAQWKGSFTRWFVDTHMPDIALEASFEGKYELFVTQGASLAQLYFPRIVFTDGLFPPIPGDGIVQNDLSFEALGSIGVPGTSCFTFSEA